jgi:hypothetical protein
MFAHMGYHPHMNAILILGLSTIAGADPVPKLDSQERAVIIETARKTLTRHFTADTNANRSDNIDAKHWGNDIAKLKPVRVRNDRANIAIVLSEKDGVEEGFYVSNPISSYAPNAKDGFTLLDRLGDPKEGLFGHMYHYKLKIKAK